jgi:hypothetical protein
MALLGRSREFAALSDDRRQLLEYVLEVSQTHVQKFPLLAAALYDWLSRVAPAVHIKQNTYNAEHFAQQK